MEKILFLILAILIFVSAASLSVALVNKEDHEHELTETAEVQASCTADGVKAYYTCGICFKLYSDAEGKNRIMEPEVIEKIPHNEVIDAAVEPTCTQSGKTEGKHCDMCGVITVKQKTLTKLGHSYTDYQPDGNATCLSDGTESAKCDRCDETDTRADAESALGHAFTEYKPDGNATCLSDGTESAKCDRCDVTDTKAAEGSKLGHSFTAYTSDGNATCLADGTESAKCDRCDETDTRVDVDSKLPHTYNCENTELEGALKSLSDCESPAIYYKSCSCGAISDSETFIGASALGHSYTEQIKDASHVRTSADDCQSVESYWYDCARCDSVSAELYYETGVVGSHNISDSFITEGGYHFNKCTVSGCDHVENKAACSDIDSDSDHKCDVCLVDGVSTHSYGEPVKVDDNNHKQTCNCGHEIVLAHAWSETERVDATHTSAGHASYECSCGATKIENLPALEGCNYNQSMADEKYLKAGATCDSGAVYFKSCICGKFSDVDDAETFVSGSALGHSFTNYESNNNATCLTDGTESAKCDRCDATDSRVVAGSALGHNLGDWITTVSPNCTTSGEKTKYCSRCDYTEKDNIAPMGHSYGSAVYSWSSDYSTCTATRACAHDASHTDSETVNTTSTTTSASCIAEGNIEYVAVFASNAFAQQTKNVTLPKIGHSDVAPMDFVCDVCLDLIDNGEAKTDYVFDVATNNPFVDYNGGSANGLNVTNHSTNGKYYENSYGKTFSISIYVEEATVIDFMLMVNARWNGVTTDNTVTEILLDGTSYGVKRYSTAIAPTDPEGMTNSANAWITSNAASVVYASIALHAGENTITFTRTSTNSQATNINICGVKIASSVEVGFACYQLSLPEVNLFAPENGGYTDVAKGDLILNNASNGSFYQNTYGKTFSFTVASEGAGRADLFLHLNHAKVASDVLTTIEKLVVNGVDVTESLVNTPIPHTGNWTPANSVYILLANLELKDGLNEIVIVRKADKTDANNLNIRGVRFVSETVVDLADVYSFNMDTATGDQTNDPFTAENGGSIKDSDTTLVENGLHRYGNGRGALLTMTVYVEENTTVVLYFNASWRGNEYFGYNMYADGHAHISSLTVNGSTDGVTPSDKLYYSVGWNTFTSCELATIELKAGYNVIEFKIADSNEGGDNVNFTGVNFISATPVTLGKTYVFNLDTATGDQTNDPFTAANGGSNSEASTLKAESNVYRYGDGNGAVLSTTIVLSESATIVYKFNCAWRTNGSNIGVFTPFATTGGNLHPYLKDFTVKDESGNVVTEGIVLSDKSYNSVGWFSFTDCEIATMTLDAGTYVISFSIAGDNMNYIGISITSGVPVTLGKSEE